MGKQNQKQSTARDLSLVGTKSMDMHVKGGIGLLPTWRELSRFAGDTKTISVMGEGLRPPPRPLGSSIAVMDASDRDGAMTLAWGEWGGVGELPTSPRPSPSNKFNSCGSRMASSGLMGRPRLLAMR